MTISRDTIITATGTGVSPQVVFADSDSVLVLTSSSWGSASIELSLDNIDYVPLENSSGPIVVTSNKAIFLYGGLFYRLNVASWSANIVGKLGRLMK